MRLLPLGTHSAANMLRRAALRRRELSTTQLIGRQDAALRLDTSLIWSYTSRDFLQSFVVEEEDPGYLGMMRTMNESGKSA